MIRKIVSSGRTGVELAGLDIVLKLGIDLGGWSPRGMRNDDGPIPDHYHLETVLPLGFKPAMEKNIKNSDGTLLITRGQKSIETRYAVETALRFQKQFLHIDLSQHSDFESASLTSSWVALQHIHVLFITGPSANQDSKIYGQVKKILETAVYLEFVKTGLHPDRTAITSLSHNGRQKDVPQNVGAAVERLKEVLPLKDRAVLANMQPNELDHLKSGLGDYIKQNFGLYTGNKDLLESCAQWGKVNQPLADEACAVILRALWKDLKATHRLRIVKS